MKLFCRECHQIFDARELVTVKDDPSPDGVGLPSGYYEYSVCPNCGNDFFDDVITCKRCGEDMQDDGYEICPKCKEEVNKSFKVFVEMNMGDMNSADAKETLLTFLAETQL